MAKSTTIVALLAVAAISAIAGGCGSDSNSGNSFQESQDAFTADVKATDSSLEPENVTATSRAGKIKLVATNGGRNMHDLYILKTDEDPGSLKVEEDIIGKPSYKNGLNYLGSYESLGQLGVGSLPEEEASTILDVPAGKYVIVSNSPGDYKRGVYATLTVK